MTPKYFDSALFRVMDSAKALDLNAKKAFLKVALEIGSDLFTTNIRLNTSALPESTAHQIIMHKLLWHDNLTQSIQSKILEQETLAKSIQSKILEQETLAKSIQSKILEQETLTKSIQSKMLEQNSLANYKQKELKLISEVLQFASLFFFLPLPSIS